MVNKLATVPPPPADEASSVRLLSSTLKCLRLLETIAAVDRPVRLSWLALEVGAPRSAVHLQLATLVHAGWLERVDGGRYRLTLRALRIGQAALAQGGLGPWVLPAMETLAVLTGESVSLSVLDGGHALIVWRVESRQILRIDLRVGTRMSVEASASGRVLAAFADPALVARAVADGATLPPGPLVASVRADGWATSVDDFAVGIAAVAAPVRAGPGHAIGALSIAGPSSRFDPTAFAGRLCETARTLSLDRGDAQHA